MFPDVSEVTFGEKPIKYPAEVGAGDKVAFGLVLETDQPGLLKFLKALNEIDRPAIVTSISVRASEAPACAACP